MKKIVAFSAFILLAISSTVTQAKINPWQDCGIGSMIFPDNGTASAISNIIWDLGTTAVTSASASEDSCEGAGARTAQFIFETYENLENEIVRGEGEHITAMLNLMSCDADGHNEATRQIRSEVSAQILDSDEDTIVKAERLHQIAQTASVACTVS